MGNLHIIDIIFYISFFKFYFSFRAQTLTQADQLSFMFFLNLFCTPEKKKKLRSVKEKTFAFEKLKNNEEKRN